MFFLKNIWIFNGTTNLVIKKGTIYMLTILTPPCFWQKSYQQPIDISVQNACNGLLSKQLINKKTVQCANTLADIKSFLSHLYNGY